MDYSMIFVAALAVFLFPWLWRAGQRLLWRPYKLTKIYQQQGLRGPSYRPIEGSLKEMKRMNLVAKQVVLDVHSHDIISKVLPHYHKWSTQYGRSFFYWWGTTPRLCITDPELVRQVLSSKFGFFPKPKPRPSILAFLGKGLLFTEGEDWVRHRRVVSPAFTMEKLKMMTTTVAECALTMFQEWMDVVSKDDKEVKEIDMAEQFKELTANVISHTAFGSCYREGKEAFVAQQELVLMAVASLFSLNIPGMQYLPTKWNIRKRKLEKQLKSKLMEIITARLDSEDYGNDLLGLMLETCGCESSSRKNGLKLNMDEIIDECKTFFFGGHETTSHLLAWTVFLLSTNQEWQERLRNEVLTECGTQTPNKDMLDRLKLVNMVLLESLRLYSPVIIMTREAPKDMNIGNLKLPKGTVVTIPILMIHRDKELWGEDAKEFNPLRFQNGVLKASKHPNGFVAFSTGPRACIGQNFAMLEAKMVMAMMLQRFSFSLSADYKHAPTSVVTLQPQFGLPVIVKPLNI